MNCLRFSNFKSIKKKCSFERFQSRDLLTTKLVDILNESIIEDESIIEIYDRFKYPQIIYFNFNKINKKKKSTSKV